ncbi:MAG: trypsin-like peptidase domain-containing protein [Anaerolineaceae bacterium]|nr:trypsin-like peptidase domain-containing protein [Anaerolineaceae bacterium]
MKKRIISMLLVLLVVTSMACSQSAWGNSNASELFSDAIDQPLQVATAVVVNPSLITIDEDLIYQQEDVLVQLYENVSQGVVAIQTIGSLGEGLGSGFVYDHEGHIVTNYHVIEGAEDLEIDFVSGHKVRGTVIATDLDSDLAVIKIDVSADILNPIPLADSDLVKVGQTVVAIGNPFGLNSTMTLGIVSAKGRTMDSFRESPNGGTFTAGDLLQTDASINPGNSGGPLINLSGQIIGLNRAIRTTDTNGDGEPVNSGIGFAVSSNVIRKVVPALISNGLYDYPYIGVSARDELTLLEREALGLENLTGAYVVAVVEEGPAESSGLQAGTQETDYLGLYGGGDLIIGIDDVDVRVFGDLLSYLITHKSPGDEIRLKILRDGDVKELTIVLGKRP